ncbi:hypothetical protein V9T40_011920 [Parthenolecanium corni]|uniref:INO80 complex subunit E N-terminal domain-containing protein n=1 Tax=Parthenolecanium corni TaxID=536013 RepID=A0AAN9T7Q6_9HEMI
MFMNKTPVSKSAKDGHGHKYKRKYRDLKKYIVSLVYENAALCDQITYLQDKILYIKEETNFLTRKMQQIEFQRAELGRTTEGIETNHDTNLKKLLMRRKLLPPAPPPPPPSVPDAPLKSPLKMKKPVNKNVKKKQTLPVSEEACGQITFPISVSDDLNIQCLGEIVTDRSTFHAEDMIYPAGYVSRKVYASSRNPKLKAAYTCKIIDAGLFPRFEIQSEDGLLFVGSTPDECHQKLLSRINSVYAMKVVNNASSCGADFFGLSNTTVHYLILSLPGASKCIKYHFKKFQEKLAAKDDVLLKDDIDVCVNYSALQKVLPESYNREHFVTDAWLSG